MATKATTPEWAVRGLNVLKKLAKVLVYLGVSILISEAFQAALGDFLASRISDSTLLVMVNAVLVVLTKSLKEVLPETSKIRELL